MFYRYAFMAGPLCIGVNKYPAEMSHPSLISLANEEEDFNPIGWSNIDGEWVEANAWAESNIINAPALGFGGPTGKELFHGNR